MVKYSQGLRKRRFVRLVAIVFFICEITFVMGLALARDQDISGYSTEDTLRPNEQVLYRFSNDINLELT
ncbi:MAG: hypothetical protein ACOC44_14725, partial [Promethearchaeia archaeon]